MQRICQIAANPVNRHVLELKLQTTRQDGYGKFVDLGRCQQELHVRWRFFKNLQQSVERRLAEHVYLVNEIHLEAPSIGHVLGAILQVVHVFDFVLRRTVHLNQIDKPAFADRLTRITTAARFCAHALLTIKTAGKNPRDSCFANTPGAGKQIGVMQPVVVERV